VINTICICGAGTMGRDITQACAQNGFNTILFDVNESILENAKQNIQNNLKFLIDKEKISLKERQEIFERIKFVRNINDCSADFIIEAVVENIDVKIDLFNRLTKVNNSKVIFASNTSSLSVTQIQKNNVHPERVIGMHFFNPATVMKLVEVIKGGFTGNETVEEVQALCKQLGKTPVFCKDVPGFIVNRVARHYYLEALRLVEEGSVSFENVDAIMESTGFKMGPFKLMDLIGIDINLSVSQSMYEAFDHTERFKPSSIQVVKVKNGELGKKTAKGFYNYY
jgi:3-hydroxybutyryl-CoA dehydrogenase